MASSKAWWVLSRAAICAASIVVCMVLLGDAGSAWIVLCWPTAIITSLAFSRLGLAACTYIRSWQDFDLVTLVQLPLFLFSATFFPISLYPKWIGAIITFSPLYQSAAPMRDLALGQFHWVMLLRVGYLLALGVTELSLAARRFRSILAPWGHASIGFASTGCHLTRGHYTSDSSLAVATPCASPTGP